MRTVATRSLSAKGPGAMTLTLALASSYASLAGAHGGLSATVTVVFTASGHPALRQSLLVTFLRKPDRSKTAKAHRSVKSSKALNRDGRPTRGGRT